MSTWLAIRLYLHSCSHLCAFTHTHKQVSSQEGKTASDSSQVQSLAEESQPEVTFWQEVMDANTNHVYYWNPETNEVTWTLPANGVIANEVTGSGGDGGIGTGQDGMGTENSTSGGAAAEPKQSSQKLETKSEVVSSQKETAKSSAAKKVAKKAEIDMFESPMEESSPKKKQPQASQAVEEDTQAAVAAQERGSSKKRKASPEPTDSSTDKEPAGKKKCF